MGYTPRPLAPGALYHVYPHLHDRVDHFDDRDRMLLLRLLARQIIQREWRLWTYCLMGNHAHFVVKTPHGDLDGGMRDLLSEVALRLNRFRGRRSALWHRPYGASLIDVERHGYAALRYVPMNPVAAGLCAHPAQWAWSSHRFLTGEFPAPDWLAVRDVHEILGGPGGYRELLEGAMPGGGRLDLARTAIPAVPEPMRPISALITEGTGHEIAEAYYEGHSLAAIAGHLGLHSSSVGRRLASRRGPVHSHGDRTLHR